MEIDVRQILLAPSHDFRAKSTGVIDRVRRSDGDGFRGPRELENTSSSIVPFVTNDDCPIGLAGRSAAQRFCCRRRRLVDHRLKRIDYDGGRKNDQIGFRSSMETDTI